jgi:hypothetical protein
MIFSLNLVVLCLLSYNIQGVLELVTHLDLPCESFNFFTHGGMVFLFSTSVVFAIVRIPLATARPVHFEEWEGGREGGRDGGREGGREGGWVGGSEGGREGAESLIYFSTRFHRGLIL